MAKTLPDKVKLRPGQTVASLTAADKAAYEAYYAEKARRKNLKAKDVAQEALDALEEIEARGGCSSEVFTEFGYSLRVLKVAVAEQDRIKQELGKRPSKDVTSEILSVAAVKAKYEIPEFKPEPIPE